MKQAEFCESIESIVGVQLAFYPYGQVCITSLFDLNPGFVFSLTGLHAERNARVLSELDWKIDERYEK